MKWRKFLVIVAFPHVASLLLVDRSYIIPECQHLSIDDNQVNSFEGQHGGKCCMCPIGTFLNQECTVDKPNSTICKPCQYDEVKKSYIDHVAHVQKKCKLEKVFCSSDHVYIPGSPSSSAKCICPDGTVEVDRGYRCEPISTSTPTTSSMKVMPTTRKTSTATTSRRTISQTSPENSNEFQSDVAKVGETSKKNVMTSVVPTIAFRENTHNASSNSTDANSNVMDAMSWGPTWPKIVAGVITVLLVAIAVFLCKVCNCTVYEDISNLFSTSRKGEDVYVADKSSHVPVAFEVEDDDVEQLESSSSPLIKDAGTIIGKPVGGNSAHPMNENGRRHRNCDQGALSEQEENLRYQAFEEMAKLITENDLCTVGRCLLPKKGKYFEDIYDDKRKDRTERARRVFLRAAELNPVLRLQTLRNAVHGLGYLQEIVDAKIMAMGTDELPN